MKIYIDYVLKNLAGPTAFITLSLVAVVWLTQSLRFIDLIINQGLPIYDFLRLVVLLLPSLLGLVLPIAMLCSTLYTYNKLNHESEILVLKAAGVSRMGIARPCIILALIVTAMGYSISAYFLPASYREFKDMQNYFRDNYASLMLEEGIFNTPLQGIMVYVRNRETPDTLKGILIHDNRVPNKPVTLMAESARIERGNDGLQFVLTNATRQQIDRKNGEVNLLYFESYPFDIGFYNTKEGTRGRKSDELFISELLNPDPSLNKKTRNKQIADGHNRIIWPLNSFALPLMVMAFLLSGDYNRRGQSRRIISAIILSIVVIASGLALKNLAAGGKSFAIILMYLPPLVTIMASTIVLMGYNPFRKRIAPASNWEVAT